MEEKLTPVCKDKSEHFDDKRQKQKWKEIEYLLNLVYQETIEHLTKISWYKLSTDQIIYFLLKYNVDLDFIVHSYCNELNRMAKKREEIEVFTFSRPQF